MKYLYLALSLVALCVQGLYYFLLFAFSSYGDTLSGTLFIIILLALCVVAGILVLRGFFLNWQYVYRWILLPVPFVLLYFLIPVFARFG